MANMHLATVKEVRARIENIREDIRIPHPSIKFPRGEIVVPWHTIATVDRLALLGGFRVSEVVSKYPRSKRSGNTSSTMEVKVTEHKNTGEEVLLISVQALKKKSPVLREIGIPLSSKHEPLARFVLDEWDRTGGNPCSIDRYDAWKANRVIFEGLNYRVMNKAESKPGANHFLRHIRATELRELQLTADERVSFFRWSPGGVGMNPMLFTYSMPEWFEYFPKLLKYERGLAPIR